MRLPIYKAFWTKTKLARIGVILFAAALLIQPLPASAATSSGQIMFILDASSSMLAKDGGSTTRFDRAKAALSQALSSIPPEIPVGLRVYGSTVGEDNQAAGCQDTKLISAPKASNANALKRALGDVQSKGWTLMGKALQSTQGDFTGEGSKTIILISDGLDTCMEPNACEVAKTLSVGGTKVKINSLGLLVNAEAKAQLQCIASGGQGEYFDIANMSNLETTLKSLAKKEVELFKAKGLAVKGTLRVEESPLLDAGQRYTDTLTIPQELFYSYELNPGEKLTVTVKAVGTGHDLGATDYLHMNFYDYSTESPISIGAFSRESGRFSGKNSGANLATTTYTFDSDNSDLRGKKRIAIGVSIDGQGNDGFTVPLEITSSIEGGKQAADSQNNPGAVSADSNKSSWSPLAIILATLGAVLALAALAGLGIWFYLRSKRTAHGVASPGSQPDTPNTTLPTDSGSGTPPRET